MPKIKSMKSNVNKQTEPVINKSKNMFDALSFDNDDKTEDNQPQDVQNQNNNKSSSKPLEQKLEQEQEQKLEQEKEQEDQKLNLEELENKQTEIKLSELLESKPSKITDDKISSCNDTTNLVNNKKDDMLNITDNINIAEFINDNKNKFRKDSKYRQDMKHDEKVLEYKHLYDETNDYGDIGNDLKLNSHWTVWVHRSDNQDWTLHGYQKRYIINSIGSFWRFFNNFQFYDCYKNQLFIMRGEIAPIWEDVNNKFGGICSIKVDSTQRGFKTDISTEIFISICMLIMNETFIVNNEDINGISYAVKKKNILIKIWTKTYHEDNKFIGELPKPLINKFNSELQRQLASIMGPDYKMSIQYKQIKPEYNI